MDDDILINIIDFVGENTDPANYSAIRTLYNSIYLKEINTSNVVSYIVLLMKIADTIENLSSDTKKSLVIFVLKKYIELNITDATEQVALDTLIDKVAPNMIDILISLDNKEIIIKAENQIQTFCGKFQKIFCSCCIKS